MMSWTRKIKFHSTACKISVQVDNISYRLASWKPWVLLQLVPNTLSLQCISMGRSIMDSNLVEKKKNFSPWFIIFCMSYEFHTWNSTSSALCRSTVWRMCETWRWWAQISARNNRTYVVDTLITGKLQKYAGKWIIKFETYYCIAFRWHIPAVLYKIIKCIGKI